MKTAINDDCYLNRIGAAAPRWTAHFFALTLRELGDAVEIDSENGTFTEYSFKPNYAEGEEFPELAGVAKLTIQYNHITDTIEGRIDGHRYATFYKNGKGEPHQVSDYFDSYAEAKDWFDVMTQAWKNKRVPESFFLGTPYVASAADKTFEAFPPQATEV